MSRPLIMANKLVIKILYGTKFLVKISYRHNWALLKLMLYVGRERYITKTVENTFLEEYFLKKWESGLILPKRQTELCTWRFNITFRRKSKKQDLARWAEIVRCNEELSQRAKEVMLGGFLLLISAWNQTQKVNTQLGLTGARTFL